MKFQKPLLWHSAQQLDNLSPDIICQGARRLDLTSDSKKRQEIASKIDEVISSHKGLSSPSGVTTYYTLSSFVIKTIPKERDGYGRLAPILSYGAFPNESMAENETQWIEEVSNEILSFADSIQLTLSSDTQEEIKNLLREAVEDMRQKKNLKDMWKELRTFGLMFGVIMVVPLILGRLMSEQIPQILKPLFNQNLQKASLIDLQQIIQTLVKWLMGILMTNNAILLLILKLPSLMKIRHSHKGKKIGHF